MRTRRLIAAAADGDATLHEAVGILLRALYPAAPHITHALWTDLGFAKTHGDLVDAAWPAVTVRPPLVIWEDGILMPVWDSLERRSSCAEPPAGTTQLKPAPPHAFGEGVEAPPEGLLLNR